MIIEYNVQKNDDNDSDVVGNSGNNDANNTLILELSRNVQSENTQNLR